MIYDDDDDDDDDRDDAFYDDQNNVVFGFFWFHGSGDTHVSTEAMAEMSCGQSLPKER